jgi:hypothetical protein
MAELRDRFFRAAGLIMVFLVFAAIIFVFIKTLVFDSPINDRSLRQSIVAAGVGVTVLCLMVWLLNVLKILELREGWSKLLWSVLIVSVLGNSVVVYKDFVGEKSPSMSVTCIRPIKTVELSGDLSLRTNTNYTKDDSMAFFLSVKDLQADRDGNYHVDLRYSLEDPVRQRTDFLTYDFSGNASKMRENSVVSARLAKYKRTLPDCVSDNALYFAQKMTFDLHDFPAGFYVVRTTAHDKVGGSFYVADLPIRLEQ